MKTLRTIAFVLSKILWLAALAAAGLGAAHFFLTFGADLAAAVGSPDAQTMSAPQLAALAASSIAWAAIPYVIARGWDELTKPLVSAD